MSEHDLATSNQYEINAKSPTVVAVVDVTIMNMKVGRAFNNELKEYHYGYVAKGASIPDMGRVSDNTGAVIGPELEFFQVQGERDYVNIGFVAKAQIPGVTNIEVTLGMLTIALVWDSGEGDYQSAEIVDIGDAVKTMVGGTYPMTLTDTTP